MAFDPFTWLLLAGIGADAAGSLLSPGGEGVEPFEDLDAEDLLAQGIEQLGGVGGAIQARAGQPVSLPSAVAQTPPQFSGGGLPMDIGVTGVDPAIENPALLTSPWALDTGAQRPLFETGFEFSHRNEGGIQRTPDPGGPHAPGGPAEDTGRDAVPRPGTKALLRPGVGETGRREISPTSSEDLIENQAQRGLAAVELLRILQGMG